MTRIRRRVIQSAFGLLAAFLAACVPAGVAGAGPELQVPADPSILHVAAELPGSVHLDPAKGWLLTEVGEEGKFAAEPVPAIAADGTAAPKAQRLAVAIPSRAGAAAQRRFQLSAIEPCAPAGAGFTFRELNDKSIELREGNQPVLVYNHGVITDPKVPVKDGRGSRACYVHPLYGLDGEVLTDDFPKDHYHHHGLFWAWPHVMIDGKQYDLWTYKDIQPRFVRNLARQDGLVAAVFGVENGWYVGDKKVMIERVWMTVYRTAGDARALDLHFVYIPVDKPISLQGAEGKSYGGLTLRYRVKAKDEKQTVITVPGGQSPKDLPGNAASLGRLELRLPRGWPQRRGDPHRSRASRFPADMAHAPLRLPVRGLAGREGQDV